MPNLGGLPVAAQYVLIDNTRTPTLIEHSYTRCTLVLRVKGCVNHVRGETADFCLQLS